MGQTALSDSLRAIEAKIAAGQAEEALTLAQEVQARYPRALAVQRVLGEAYLALRKPREALGALGRALAGNPEDARACCARAIVQQLQGDPLSSLGWYRRACDITPDDAVLRSAYRELAASLGQPAYEPTRMGLARLYLRGAAYPQALREWEQLVREQTDELVLIGLLETLWRAGYIPAAHEWSRRILANAPSCVKALLVLAAVELDAGNGEEAQRQIRRAAELDPEARIGRALFDDRIAAGDAALQTLLLGEEASSRLTRPPATLTHPRENGSRPLADEATQRMPGVVSQPASGRSGSRTTSAPLPGSTSRPSALPDGFHNIFAETEYMLWGRDDDESARRPVPPVAAQPAAAPEPVVPPAPAQSTPEPADMFARSGVIVPPALREQATGLDETEARAAINWIQWLQAQGARPHGATAGPAPQGGGAIAPRQTMPIRPTGPLPPATTTTEALRAMFATLGPETSVNRVVASNATPAARDEADEARQPSVTTLEALEQGFLRSGFQAFEMRPGELATFAIQPEADAETSPESQPLTSDGAAADAAAVALEPETPAEPDIQAPPDYPARLDLARQRRDEGKLPDALTEYRLILKNAPELLAEVVSELEASLEQAPEQSEIHRLLGDARLRQGDYLSAIESYNRAVALSQSGEG
ncbi:MAG: hypothetical protein OJF49_000475 [Ktedonobacterales bacterium]|jgi:tetratricopeptide (TPR) repeat protein|nr:MAG: hypothetical protein OJF49_000475 [Ktedonobacterales bacterium]